MSTAAAALLEELKKLPREEQEEILVQLQRLLSAKNEKTREKKTYEKLPTVRLPGGPITSQDVADALD